MIISLHVPKTGGETFKLALETAFGSRLMQDYGDMVGFKSDDILSHREKRAAAMRERRDQIERRHDIIHGHFSADKYRGLFRTQQYAAFFRHPMQQAMSLYKYLQRLPLHANPVIRDVQKPGVTFLNFLEREAVTNSQTELVGAMPLESFAMVALAEEFDRGVALFNATFGCNLVIRDRVNVDPGTAGREHRLSPEEQDAVRVHRAADLDLYRRARAIFHRLCVARGL